MRETFGGFHFWNLYQNCRWKFFLQYPMGIRTNHDARALLFGVAVHASIAAFLTTGKEQEARSVFIKTMEEQREKYQKQEDYTFDHNRGTILIARWCADVGRDLLRDFDVLSCEEEIAPTLPNGFRITSRPDAVLASRLSRAGNGPREVFILETKTTGWGRELTEEALANSDQVSTYVYAVGKVHPEWRVEAVIPNVLYQNKGVVGVGLGDLIYRTTRDLRDFELQTVGILMEIAQKIEGVAAGYDPIQLFDRNTSWCTSYNHPCEYIGICRHWNLEGCPHGFKQTEWLERDDVVKLSEKVRSRYAETDPCPVSADSNAAASTGTV